MTETAFITIDNRRIPINGERNILEIARKAGIDIPTFCYHSALSIYGACRLCLVEVEGRGIVASCSTPPENGMVVRTHTEEIRKMRRVAIELLLADHDNSCPTCSKSTSCQLRDLANRLGVNEVRFKPTRQKRPLDVRSPALVHDPNKCILCGDCVRACSEIQGIGVLDFVGRGADTCVAPAFGKSMGEVECVNCGQCAAVCPTGALTPKSEIADVWKALDDPTKKVVVQFAPAVRVALGEEFGMKAGEIETGRTVSALRALGFDLVFDTCFAADMTVVEESSEFLRRKAEGGAFPMFTSCCPAWVKYTEQFYPTLLPNLSTCRSPQAMFGATVKEILPKQYGIKREDLIVVSIMPCTAKKFEARQPKLAKDGNPDVDYVLTTQELARMIREVGIKFDQLEPGSLDMPFGFKTGAGVIFGNTGGVMEAVLRFAVEKVTGEELPVFEFNEVRGEEGIRETTVSVKGITLKLAVCHSLSNAKKLAEMAKNGQCPYDLIEVMACPGGCVSGGGQPVSRDWDTRRSRTRGLYDADRSLQLHKSQDNHLLADVYQKHFGGEIGGHKSHELLHTRYQSRRRISGEDIVVMSGEQKQKINVSVCCGTSCFIRGSQELLRKLMDYVEQESLHDQVDFPQMEDRVEISATFCFEQCDRGPTIRIGNREINRCTFDMAVAAIQEELKKLG